MVCALVLWLHIRASMSRSVANKVLQAIQLIISITLHLIETSLLLSGITVKLSSIALPSDIRTAYRLQCTEPKIIRTACCPQCFSLFPGPDIPLLCQWKASPRSRPCNTDLWTIQNTQHGPKQVPKCLYSTQCFDTWLRIFLSRKTIEDSLEWTFNHRFDHHHAAFGAEMHDLQDSPAWRDLHGFLNSPYHLVFGIYIDWFNPYTNKIAGMLK